MVVSSRDGLDEISIAAPTYVSHLKGGAIKNYEIAPEDAGLNRAPLGELRGGDAAENARLIEEILGGGGRGAKRDAVLLNAAAALLVAGQAKDLRDGARLAAEAIDSGRARLVLEKLRAQNGGSKP
jgi:anthranilate phosphoribosyltransferase